jgi:hypothetical protein
MDPMKLAEELRKRGPIVSSESPMPGKKPAPTPKEKPGKNILKYASETAFGPRKAMLEKASKAYDAMCD